MTHSTPSSTEAKSILSEQPPVEPELQNLPRVLHPVFKVILGGTAALAIGVPFLTGIQTSIPIVNGFVSGYQMRTATGSIKSPQNNAQVATQVDFEGTLATAPRNSSLWLVIYAPGVKKYYPYELPDSPDRQHWRLSNVEIGLPTDHGQVFIAALYLLDPTQTEEYRQTVAESWRGRRRYADNGAGALAEAKKPRPKTDRGLLTQPPGKLLQAINIQRASTPAK